MCDGGRKLGPTSQKKKKKIPPKQNHLIHTSMANILMAPPLLPHLLPPSPSSPILIIGGGLSGLAAATHLHSSNLPFLLLESSPSLGGRVRTDSLSGFLLDRGFQILLTAYPESRRLLHFPSLHLRPFYPGALVFHSNRLHRVADPFRRPLHSLLSLPNPIGSVPDKLLLGLHRLRSLPHSPETAISRRLRALGLSPSIIDRFFRPFLAGIFFDPELETSSRLFDFVFRCLAEGDNALPAFGIGSIPAQLAANLPSSSIRLNSKVLSVVPGNPPEVRLEGGESIVANRGVIVAVEQPEAVRLIPQIRTVSAGKPGRSTVCVYFSAERVPTREPILILNGSGEGIVNNMCFPTNVSAGYGPVGGPGLVSVSVVGDGGGRSDEELAKEVVRELGGWFGPEVVRFWKMLRVYRIGFAQPDQSSPSGLIDKDPRVGDRVYVCGDHWSSATFDGALVSGRRAAEALVRDLAIGAS